MESLLRLLEPYRHFDPAGWVGLYQRVPLWAAFLMSVIGAVLVFFGGERLFRLVAVPLGALIALIWAGFLAEKFGFGKVQQQVTLGAMGVLALLGMVVPQMVVFFGVGVPIGLFCGNVAGGGDWALGFTPGMVMGGAIGVVFHRPISAVLSSVVGGWLLVLGLLALSAPVTSFGQTLVRQPIAALCAGAFFAILGVTYQLFIRPAPDERARLKHEAAVAKQRQKEEKALEKRWANYTKDREDRR
jgi:hypothetical protein